MKSKRIQKLGIAAAVFALLVVVAAVIIPKLIDLNRYRGLIVTELEKAVEGKVEIGSLAWGISNGISVSVEGFSIQNAGLVPVDFKIERIDIKLSILPLLKKTVFINSLHLQRPIVHVKLPFERSQEKTPSRNQASSESTDTGLPVTIVISKIDLVDGQVTIEDALSSNGRAQEHVLDNVRLQGTNLVPGEKMQFSLAFKDTAKPGLGEFEASGTFEGLTRELRLENPRLSVMLSLDSFGLDTLKPYLKNNATARKMGGAVSLELNYQGDLGRRFTAAGSIDLSQFSYSDPQLWEQALPGGPARIDYKIRLDPERIGVDKLDLRLNNLVIGLRAGLDKWKSKPVLKDVLLSADLPLAETIPFIPWKLLKDDNAGILHATLERGGRISVDKIEIPRLALDQFPDNWEPFVSDIKAVTKLSEISVPPRANFPGLENLSADLTLTKGVLDASILQAMLGPVTLPKLDARVTDLFTKPKVTVKAKGPMLFTETEEGDHKPFYDAHGLTRITGKAAVDLNAAFDQSDPDSWQVDGFVNLDNIDADFESRGVQLKDLRGKVQIRRQKDLSIKMEGLSGLINRSPFHLDATAEGSNASNLRIDANTKVQQLDLSQLAVLVPALGKMKLSGVMDADMDVHLPLDNPRGSRLGGFLKLQDFSFSLAEPAISITDGNVDLRFPTDSVEVTQLTLRYNEQLLSVTGTASNIEHPQVNLTLKSPNLDIDRLIPPDGPSQSAAPVEGEKTEPAAKKKELPELARRSTVRLSVDVDRGTYRRSGFNHLKLSAYYDQAVLKEHQLTLEIADGRIQNSGAIDFRDLDQVHFDLKPVIESVRIEKVVSLFQTEKFPIEGPVSVSGQLSGRSGPGKELVRSLNGSISSELGSGRIYKVGPIGRLVADILSFTSLRGILSGDIFKDMAHKGVAYRDVEIKTEIENGIVAINLFKLQGDSFNANSVGAVNLVEDSLNLKIEMDTLGFIDKAIGFVPILGKGTQKLLHVYLDVNGPIDDPQIKISPVKGLTGFVGGTVESTDDLVKGTEEKIEQ